MQNYSSESPLLPGQKGALLIASMTIKQDRWKDIAQINPRKTLTCNKFQPMFDVGFFIATNLGNLSGVGFQECHISILCLK